MAASNDSEEFEKGLRELTDDSILKSLKLDYLLSYHFAKVDSENKDEELAKKKEVRDRAVERYLVLLPEGKLRKDEQKIRNTFRSFYGSAMRSIADELQIKGGEQLETFQSQPIRGIKPLQALFKYCWKTWKTSAFAKKNGALLTSEEAWSLRPRGLLELQKSLNAEWRLIISGFSRAPCSNTNRDSTDHNGKRVRELRSQVTRKGLKDIYDVLGLQVLANFQNRSQVAELDSFNSPSEVLNDARYHLFEALKLGKAVAEPFLPDTATFGPGQGPADLFLSFFDEMLSREASRPETKSLFDETTSKPQRCLLSIKKERLLILRDMYRDDLNKLFTEHRRPHLTDEEFKDNLPSSLLQHPKAVGNVDDHFNAVPRPPRFKPANSDEKSNITENEVGHRPADLFKPRVRLPWEKALVKWGQI